MWITFFKKYLAEPKSRHIFVEQKTNSYEKHLQRPKQIGQHSSKG